jgi:type I restriction enzyme S subunit
MVMLRLNFNGTKLKNIICPLPPLSEQHRIAVKLEQLMRHCNELEQSLKESQAQNEHLLQQVLREALWPGKEDEIKDALSLAAEATESIS